MFIYLRFILNVHICINRYRKPSKNSEFINCFDKVSLIQVLFQKEFTKLATVFGHNDGV